MAKRATGAQSAKPAEIEPVDTAPQRWKFEWPDTPYGRMALHKGVGYPGDITIRFVAGFHVTDDPAIAAALRQRGKLKGDVFEVALNVTGPTHGPSPERPAPPIPPNI